MPGTCSLVYLICSVATLVPDLETNEDPAVLELREYRTYITLAFTATVYSGFTMVFAVWGLWLIFRNARFMIHSSTSFKWLYLIYVMFQGFLFGVNIIKVLDLIDNESEEWVYVEISTDIFWQMFLLCFLVRTDTFDEMFGQASVLRGLIYTKTSRTDDTSTY